MQTESDAIASVAAITAKLKRIATHISCLDSAAKQHATRIINSRSRLLTRILVFLYSEPDSPLKAKAKLELDLNLDNGDILRLGSRYHTIGVLTCGACAMGTSDSLAPQRLIRLCKSCHKGLQHSSVQVTSKDGELISTGSIVVPEDVVCTVLYLCDYCHKKDEEKIN